MLLLLFRRVCFLLLGGEFPHSGLLTLNVRLGRNIGAAVESLDSP